MAKDIIYDFSSKEDVVNFFQNLKKKVCILKSEWNYSMQNIYYQGN